MLIKPVLKNGWSKWDFCTAHQFLDGRGGGVWERTRDHREESESGATTPSGWERGGDQKEVSGSRARLWRPLDARRGLDPAGTGCHGLCVCV